MGERNKGKGERDWRRSSSFFVPSPPSFSPAVQTDHPFYVARLSSVRASSVVCGAFKVDFHCRVIFMCIRT